MKLFIKSLVAILALVVFAGTIVFLYQKSQKKPIAYKIETPFITDIVRKTVATGSINPRKEISIKTKVSGIIKTIFVESGVAVKKDDILAKVQIIPDMINLNNAVSRLKKARLALEDSRKTFEREQKLYDKALINEEKFQEVETSYKKAKEEQETAENNLNLIQSGVTKMSTDSNTLIRSTIDGIVLDIPVKEGDSVIESNSFNAGTTIAQVADLSEMVFEGKIDESEVGKIKTGMDLILTIGAVENKTFKAKIEYISPKGVVDNGIIQFEIRAKIELIKQLFIRAGYSASADIVLESRKQVLAINESLLQFDNGDSFVEVKTGPKTFEKRTIKTGLSDSIKIEVLSGLSLKDEIKKPLSVN
ncbi:efflux RND transporter periplasmic adaptor subunit [bacterium]|nr:efflux RND transporter periplasmic adaptor subunit [bacterium]